MAAMLVSQTNPVGVELFSYVNTFFCSNKFARLLATWVKTLYCIRCLLQNFTDSFFVSFNPLVGIHPKSCRNEPANNKVSQEQTVAFVY